MANTDPYGSVVSDEAGRLLSPQVSIEIGKQVSRHFLVESGLHFQQNRAVLQDGLTVVNKATGQAAGYLDYTVSNDMRYGNAAGTPSNVVSLPLVNRYQATFTQVAVPLQVGYRLLPAKPVQLTVSLGFSADYLLASRLSYQSGTLLEKATARGAFHSLTASGVATAGAAYRIRPKWYLALKGFVRKSLSNLSRRETLQLYPWATGLAAGVVHEF